MMAVAEVKLFLALTAPVFPITYFVLFRCITSPLPTLGIIFPFFLFLSSDHWAKGLNLLKNSGESNCMNLILRPLSSFQGPFPRFLGFGTDQENSLL